MFKQKQTREDAEQYIESILLPWEKLEASYVWSADPIDFAVVTTHRFIGTEMAQSGNPIIRSVPFRQIAAVSVTDEQREPTLGTGQVPFLSVHLLSGDRLSIQGNVNPVALFAVYRSLIEKVCAAAAPAPLIPA